jgi:hypothetical protein
MTKTKALDIIRKWQDRPYASLLAGEMAANEWAMVRAVLRAIERELRSELDLS